MEGNILTKDAVISKSNLFRVQVTSTFPEQGTVFISPASQINIIEGNSSADQLPRLEKSLENMSLVGKDIDNMTEHMSSLQKAHNALYEVVCFPFLYKDWIDQLHIECPKGVLLYGPPGVGKTFLVSSIAKRCNAKMFIIQGPEVYGPFVGESEEKLRAKFNEAREYAITENVPVILFIDEIVRTMDIFISG